MIRRAIIPPIRIVKESDPICYDTVEVREDWAEPVRLSKKDIDKCIDCEYTNSSKVLDKA